MAMTAKSPTMKSIVGSRNARAVSPGLGRLSSGDESKDAEADRNRGRGQTRKGRGKGTHSGRYRDRDSQRVVDDQRRTSHQTGACTQVGPRHGVGATASGIRGR